MKPPPLGVYPHLRGAAARCRRRNGWTRGISPPAWGSQDHMVWSSLAVRYIPTCVGQPLRTGSRQMTSAVYPHLRYGAAPGWWFHAPHSCGISPPAWGSQQILYSLHICLRYIPTCVGQPTVDSSRERRQQVYPHLRGAAVSFWLQCCAIGGISPPAWGSHDRPRNWAPGTGYIPTCVGQPHSSRRIRSCPRVYPHLRGAAPLAKRERTKREGISPPAWGSLRHPPPTLARSRYIPTCVGQPP